jgi:selenocysteine-specific elongation factor
MRHIVVGTAGHIDHGKSALVRALTGTDPDRLKEERERGITIDLGFAHLDDEALTFDFVDVPGHERFVKNMLAGATGIDAVVLVVAADESVMPQTREHFDICRLLRVPAGIVAVTKADLVDADTIGLVCLEARELVAGSFLEGAPVIPVSSKTGEGLGRLKEALRRLGAALPARGEAGPPRLPIDRVFSVKGFGTVVTGTVVSGGFRVDDEVEVLPAGTRAKVRGLQAHGVRVEHGVAGQRLAVNLAGVDVGEVARGSVLAVPGVLAATRRFDAVVDLLPGTSALRHGARVRFHQGTSEVLGRVAVSGPAGDPAPARTHEIPPGGTAHVRVRLERPAVLTRGDRFILRAYSPQVTIAGGMVLDPHPPRGAIRTAAARARLVRLDPGAQGVHDLAVVDRALLQMLGERGASGLRRDELVGRAGLSAAQADHAVARLVRAGQVVVAGETLVATSVVAELEGSLASALAEHHREAPQSEGLPRQEARERLFAHAPLEVFETVLGRLVQAGRVAARDRLALATHKVTLSSDEARVLETVEARFRAAGLRPPDLATVAAESGLTAGAVEQAVRMLLRQQRLAKVDTLHFHADALAQLKRDVGALKQGGAQARVDVAMFKDRYGVTRKYAIPLLEYLDRERVTRRVGDVRVVL